MRSMWAQHEVKLPAFPRGCHLITSKVTEAVATSLRGVKIGLVHVFIQHTSASLTLNENTDPAVRADMETFLSQVVPEGRKAPWTHTDEGEDDMPAHVKASMLSSSVTVPVTNGRLALGTWQPASISLGVNLLLLQGIWLCEHRDHGGGRRLVVTIQGDRAS